MPGPGEPGAGRGTLRPREGAAAVVVGEALEAVHRLLHRTCGLRCRLQVTVQVQVGLLPPATFTVYEYLPDAREAGGEAP